MEIVVDQSQSPMTFKEKLESTILSHQRRTSNLSVIQRKRKKICIIPVGLSNSFDQKNVESMINNLENYLFDDVMLLVWCERTIFYKCQPINNNQRNITPRFFHHWIQLYLKKGDEVFSRHLSIIPKYGSWGDLITIYTYANQMKYTYTSEVSLLDNLRKECVRIIGDQLEHDYRILFKKLKENSNEEEKQIVIKGQEQITNCANEAPQISNNSKKSTTIMAKEIAQYLQSLSTTIDNKEQPLSVWKGYAYQSYRSIISTICQMLEKVSSTFVDPQIGSSKRKDHPLFSTREKRAKFLTAPFSSHITNPKPQPVVSRSLEEFQPLLEHLLLNKPGPSDDNQPIVFQRGTIMSGGRLDLCKQVVGPKGVQPLLNAIKHNSYVSRLLLGNNIVGFPGAEAISQYIRSNPDSNIDTWYIACNRFDSQCILMICDAFANDTKVKALWLKRNPILASGAVHIGRMLTSNTYLQTLDLLNTGLLDEGCEILFNGLKVNHTLKHLYIDANGLTIKSGQIIRLHFQQRYNHLETLSLSCNVLADQGTSEIAAGLKYDQCLKRLSLASNSIGPDGVRALVDALIDHQTLEQLNLGFMKSTNLLGHLNNIIGDEGALQISRLIQFNHHIRSIDLTLNSISQQGLIHFRDALKVNRTLTTLKGLKFKRFTDKIIVEDIKTRIETNQIEWGKQLFTNDNDHTSLLTKFDYLKKGEELDHQINYPEHIKDVISHYRTQ